MAADQWALESVEAGGPPVLRIYKWSEPTISLGYFQNPADSSRFPDSIPRVRRRTGGGAILHHFDLTYSLAMPSNPSQRGVDVSLYRRMHRVIGDAFEALGVQWDRHFLVKEFPEAPFLCFQRRFQEDLVFRGYKIVGSAQRRSRRGVLQHGSCLLEASQHAPELPGVWDLLGCRKDDRELVRLIRLGFASEFDANLATEGWNEEELEQIEKISKKFCLASSISPLDRL